MERYILEQLFRSKRQGQLFYLKHIVSASISRGEIKGDLLVVLLYLLQRFFQFPNGFQFAFCCLNILFPIPSTLLFHHAVQPVNLTFGVVVLPLCSKRLFLL